jgi:hypothetical protein
MHLIFTGIHNGYYDEDIPDAEINEDVPDAGMLVSDLQSLRV